MKNFSRDLLVVECLNIQAWYEKARQEKKLDGLSVQTLWALRKNMKKIQEIVNNFNEFKAGLESDLQQKFFTDQKSEETTIQDENGGSTNVRKVKDEYINEYQEEINQINSKLNELAMTKETFSFSAIDMEEEIEKLDDSCHLDMDDLDILSAFENNDEEKDA